MVLRNFLKRDIFNIEVSDEGTIHGAALKQTREIKNLRRIGTITFDEVETYWPINTKVSVGDIVYIYLAAPYKQLAFVSRIKGVDFYQDSIMDYIRPFFMINIDNKKTSPKLFMKLQTISRIGLSK